MTKGRSIFSTWKVLLGIAVCTVVLIDANCNTAWAETQDISQLVNPSSDFNTFLGKAKTVKNFILRGGMALAILCLIGSWIMTLPFVGKKEQGMEAMKISFWVFVGCALGDLILGWIVSMAQT